ncbi:transposase, partial [Asanoa siamensis]|uniref:transposase n=1 Tax=Asanoa siamensis TaxID=926357 RepID=UPI0019430CFA
MDQRGRRIGLPGRSIRHTYRPGLPSRRDWRRTRFAVRAGREHLDEQHREILGLRRHRYRLWRTWELKEQLRDLYRSTDPAHARTYLRRWCTSAKRSRIPAYTNLVRRIEKHFDAIVAAVELGLSNSRLEGSTPESGSSNAAATATETSTHSPPPSIAHRKVRSRTYVL